MAVSNKYDPYRHPTPYEVLGVKGGLEADARAIGRAHSDERRKAAPQIKDTATRARRMAELDQARDELLRPDDRVLLDFFALASDFFADLCLDLSRKLAGDQLPAAADLLGGLGSARPYDDLVPDDLGALEQPFPVLEAPEFFTEPHEVERLPLVEIEL